jgi:hypothetical protein
VDLQGAAGLGTDTELHALRDAGKRMADALNLRIIADGIAVTGRWMAFALQDGKTDHVLYDRRDEAIRHQFHETLSWYEQLRPRTYTADECAMTLHYARAAYDAGWRPQPDTPAPIMPVRLEDKATKMRQLRRAKRR